MRVSVTESDPGYGAYLTATQHGAVVQVFLNGEEQHQVITADEEEGFVEKFKLTEDGKLITPNVKPVPPLDPKEFEKLSVEEADKKIREHEKKEAEVALEFDAGIARERLTGTVRIEVVKHE